MRVPKVWVHALLIFLLGFGLRIWNMAREPLAYEEMAATLVASRGLTSYLSAVPPDFDFCPPVYYLALRPFAWLGLEVWRLRLLSALAGAAAGVLVVLGGRRFLNGRTATLAGYLLALHPLHIYFSQEIQPEVLFTLLTLGGFYFLIQSAETNRLRSWVLYDVFAVALLHTMREAIYLVATFLIVHLARALFFPLTTDQRRLRRGRLLQSIAYHYGAIILVAIPWLIIMPRGVRWVVNTPGLMDLVQVPLRHWIRGMAPARGIAWTVLPAVAYLLLLPPALKSLRPVQFRGFALVTCLLGAILLPFLNSLKDKPRFDAAREAMTALPFLALVLGALIARCNFYIRTLLVAFFGCMFLSAAVRQSLTIQKPPYQTMMAALHRQAHPSSTVAFWPSYATTFGHYWNAVYGTNFKPTSAEDLLARWAEIPDDRPIYFVAAQFPENSPILYTFRGALRQFSRAETLWEDPASYNAVIRARHLNRAALKGWYEEPRTLDIVDARTSATEFIFTPGDPVFSGPQFHQDRLDASYDRAGRRVVWTAVPNVDLQLGVTLYPGHYVLRLHASPEFDPPAALLAGDGSPVEVQREVELTLRAFEQRRLRLKDEETISIYFSTDVEVSTVPVHLKVDPMVTLRQPERRDFGLKIYSIAIEQAPTPAAPPR